MPVSLTGKGSHFPAHPRRDGFTNSRWAAQTAWAGIDLNEFPKVKEWHAKLGGREAFQKGANVPPKGGSKKKK